VICAGLYPNIACVRHPKRYSCGKLTKSSVSTKFEPEAHLAMKSVNEALPEFDCPWLVYYSRMKNNNYVNIHDSTMISPYTLLFFGGKLSVGTFESQCGISVDDNSWIKFYCSRTHADLIMKLRSELDEVLDYKYLHPGPIDWEVNSKEVRVLKMVVELISSDDGRRAAAHKNATYDFASAGDPEARLLEMLKRLGIRD